MSMAQEGSVKIKQAKIGEVAQGMLDGSLHYLKGAVELAALRHDIGAYENDPDFFAFVAILSEVDSLPIDGSPHSWTKEDMLRYKAEIQDSVEWAKEFSLAQCQSLAERFGKTGNIDVLSATDGLNTVNEVVSKKAYCPYCGESIELLVDSSEPQQGYIEDCQVCCRPINCDIDIDPDGYINLTLRHENE